VQKIQVVGSTILSQDEINALVKPLEGRSATLEELKQIADKITEIYLNRGYITSRAVLPPQTITAGVVQIQVIEGKLTRIEIEGTKRLDPSYIRSRIRLGARMPLSTASLEDQLRLLRVDPLFSNVEASLRAGDNEGESILIVRVSEANPFQPSFSIDNYSPPSVGSERVGVSLRHRNITGNGDELGAAYYRSLGDSDVFDFSYRLPLNAMNGTLQLRAAPNRNSIVQPPFNSLTFRENRIYLKLVTASRCGERRSKNLPCLPVLLIRQAELFSLANRFLLASPRSPGCHHYERN
jgi:hemolysin activation/secretion protein